MSAASELRDGSRGRRCGSGLSVSPPCPMGFPSAPSRACSASALGPRPGSQQLFRGPQELLLASPLLQGPMVSKAAWRGAPGRSGRGASLRGWVVGGKRNRGDLKLWSRQKVAPLFVFCIFFYPTVVLEVGMLALKDTPSRLLPPPRPLSLSHGRFHL